MPAKKKRLIQVSLDDLDRVCHNCGKVKDDTRSRTFYAKNYMGPCGDSFCYASCDMDTCRPTTKTICDSCEKKLAKKK